MERFANAIMYSAKIAYPFDGWVSGEAIKIKT